MKLPSKNSEHDPGTETAATSADVQLAPGKLSLSGVRSRAVAGSRPVDRKSTGAEIAPDARARIDEAAGRGGRRLPDALRAELERALGADLSAVVVHTDSAAADAATAINARAFASGDDIYFAKSEYDPSSTEGRRLIAHEVAHTVQSPSTREATAVSRPGDAHELAADAFADAFTAGARGPVAEQPAAPSGVIHRQEPSGGRTEEAEAPSHEDQLREIQAMQMSSLLPAIAALPAEVKTDYQAGHVGGPRLVAAMHAVNGGGDWKSYITAHNDVAGHLPADQLDAIMSYLGGHSGQFRFYKNVGNFDGSVEPGGYITLYFRVNFWVQEGTNLSGMDLETADGRPTGWWTETLAAVAKFGADFKQKVEPEWSDKAMIECKSSNVVALKTKVVISVVDTGYHARIQLVPGARSHMDGVGATTGTWSVGDNVEQPTRGGTQRQRASSHEFGHAIGVPHPDAYSELKRAYDEAKTPAEKKKAEEALYRYNANPDKDSAAYGDSEAEHRHQMGGGSELVAIGGPDAFDPFTPFQEIAKRWGDEFIVAPAVNEWTTA